MHYADHSPPPPPSAGEFHCSFEEEPICMFTQDKNDDFDWTRHSAATRDTKYTPNTGPSGDRSGSKQGEPPPGTSRDLQGPAGRSVRGRPLL